MLQSWGYLFEEFKKCEKEDKIAVSGSAAKNHEFPYFENLLFLKPALEQRPALSSVNLSSASGKNAYV